MNYFSDKGDVGLIGAEVYFGDLQGGTAADKLPFRTNKLPQGVENAK